MMGFALGKKGGWVFWVAVACFCGFIFSACEKEKKMEDPKAALAAAAEKYWKKRWIEKDYDAIYSMETRQDDLPLEKYKAAVQNRGQINYLSVKIEDVAVEGQEGSVKVVVNCQVQGMTKPMDLSIRDRWVIEENQWKHVLKKDKSMLAK